MTRVDPRDETAIRAKLEETLGPVIATDLHAHLKRDGVFVVDAAVSLIECGVAVAMDDAVKVEAWVGSGALRRPTPEERAAWLASTERSWNAIVVQPFVLVQDLPE